MRSAAVAALLLAACALVACAPAPRYEPEPTPLPDGTCEDAAEVWDPLQGGCVPLECGPGPYAEPPAGALRLVHVDPAWSGGSNGGVTNPYRSLGAALAATGPGDTVLLAAGEHAIDEALQIVAEDTHILGRCPALSRIVAAGTALDIGQAPGATLQGVSVHGPGGTTPDAALVSCFNATGLSLVDLVLEDAAWHGVSLFQCGDVLLSGVSIEGAARYGLFSAYSSRVTLDAVEIAGTRFGPEGEGGYGAYIGQGDTPTVVSSTLRDNAGGGLYITESQDGTLAGLELRDNGGPGATLLLSGNIWLRDSDVIGNVGVGVHFGYTTGGVLDSDVAETVLLPDGTGGQGLFVTNAQGVEVANNTVRDNHEVGIGVTLSTGTVHDNTVIGTRPNAAGVGGRGIELAVVNDVLVEANTVTDQPEIGISLLGGSADIRNNVVERIGRPWWPSDVYQFGHGIHAQNVGAAFIVGNTVREAHHVGIYLFTGSGPEIRGNTVTGTVSGPPPFKFGDGMQIVEIGGLLEVQGNALSDNDRAGILVDGSTVEVIGGTLRDNWAAVISQNGASVELEAVDVGDNGSDTMLVHGPRIHRVHAQGMTALVVADPGDE